MTEPKTTPQFQFHKGTIRTGQKVYTKLMAYLFQFHKGTIRTDNRVVAMCADKDFNSIKVRLEHCKKYYYSEV